MPLSKRFIVLLVAAVAALSVGGCSIKSDDGKDDNNNSSVPTTPTVPTTPQTTPTTPPTTPSTTPTEPTTTPSSGRTQETDIAGITTTIRRYFDAGRKGNAAEWCGQQSDPLLEKNFGGLSQCVASETANKADGDIPPGRNLNFDNAISLDGDTAVAEPRTIDGSTKYTIDLVYEGSNGGWAVNKISNNS